MEGVDRAGLAGVLSVPSSLPKTSRAICPIPPSDPISEDASIGISTTFEFFAVPIEAMASVYFCAMK